MPEITPAMQERLIKGMAYIEKTKVETPDGLATLMTQSRDAFMAEVNGLSEAQMSWSPGEKQWSVKEVCLHVSNAIGLCDTLIQALTQGIELEEAKDIKMGVLDPDPGSLDTIRANVLKAFDKAIQGADGLRGAPNMTAKSPHPLFGPLDCRQWSAFNILHANVHVGQVRRVKGTAGFPA